MKYIIAVDSGGTRYPLVFDDRVTHAVAARAVRADHLTVRSAGFCSKGVAGWTTHGRSESLNVGPHSEDATLLDLFLTQGLSGLDLENVLALESLRSRP